MAAAKTMDLTEGSVVKKMLAFTFPIILGNMLQQLYTAADRIVVGRFAEDGTIALAAIGATASAINLIIGLFVGIAVGVNVICANLLGSRNHNDLRKSMHTSVVVAAVCGLFLCVVGICISRIIMVWLSTPQSVMDLSTLYMRIYFVGVPANLLYNFGAGILRAHGDTKRPMYILMLSGIANVILNLVFVLGFRKSVEGVAIATVLSQYISAFLVLRILFDARGQYQLKFNELKVDQRQLMAIIRVGVPSGLGSVVFSASNTLLQSSVNSFDNAAIIAGRTAATDINILVYQIQAGFLAACVSFSGQCYGARDYKRIDKVALTATLLCGGILGSCSVLTTTFAPWFISLFNTDPEVIRYGATILVIYSLGLFTYIPAEIYMGCSRGMKRALAPTVLNMLAITLPRVFWILVVFPKYRDIGVLYLCYPISWACSTVVQVSYYYVTRRKLDRQMSVSGKE